MTPTQRNRAVEIMQKHGQYGWKIEYCTSDCIPWKFTSDPAWNWDKFTYRAVGPRKRLELKRGMEVLTHVNSVGITLGDQCSDGTVLVWIGANAHTRTNASFTHYRWPNGDGTWLPIEGEPEIISMDGME